MLKIYYLSKQKSTVVHLKGTNRSGKKLELGINIKCEQKKFKARYNKILD